MRLRITNYLYRRIDLLTGHVLMNIPTHERLPSFVPKCDPWQEIHP